MTRVLIAAALTAAAAAASASGASAESVERSAFKWGVGMQGNAPYIGGINVTYRGFDPLNLRLFGHFWVSSWEEGYDRSSLIGLQTPIVVGRSRGYQIYIGPGFALRNYHSESSREYHQYEYPTGSDPMLAGWKRHEYEDGDTELYGTLLLGVELYIDAWFGLEPQERFGINFEFGQRVSKERSDRYNRETLYADESKNDLVSDKMNESSDTHLHASLTAGLGFTVYF